MAIPSVFQRKQIRRGTTSEAKALNSNGTVLEDGELGMLTDKSGQTLAALNGKYYPTGPSGLREATTIAGLKAQISDGASSALVTLSDGVIYIFAYDDASTAADDAVEYTVVQPDDKIGAAGRYLLRRKLDTSAGAIVSGGVYLGGALLGTLTLNDESDTACDANFALLQDALDQSAATGLLAEVGPAPWTAQAFINDTLKPSSYSRLHGQSYHLTIIKAQVGFIGRMFEYDRTGGDDQASYWELEKIAFNGNNFSQSSGDRPNQAETIYVDQSGGAAFTAFGDAGPWWSMRHVRVRGGGSHGIYLAGRGEARFEDIIISGCYGRSMTTVVPDFEFIDVITWTSRKCGMYINGGATRLVNCKTYFSGLYEEYQLVIQAGGCQLINVQIQDSGPDGGIFINQHNCLVYIEIDSVGWGAWEQYEIDGVNPQPAQDIIGLYQSGTNNIVDAVFSDFRYNISSNISEGNGPWLQWPLAIVGAINCHVTGRAWNGIDTTTYAGKFWVGSGANPDQVISINHGIGFTPGATAPGLYSGDPKGGSHIIFNGRRFCGGDTDSDFVFPTTDISDATHPINTYLRARDKRVVDSTQSVAFYKTFPAATSTWVASPTGAATTITPS